MSRLHSSRIGVHKERNSKTAEEIAGCRAKKLRSLKFRVSRSRASVVSSAWPKGRSRRLSLSAAFLRDHCARTIKNRTPREPIKQRELSSRRTGPRNSPLPYGEFNEKTIINEASPPPYLIKNDGGLVFSWSNIFVTDKAETVRRAAVRVLDVFIELVCTIIPLNERDSMSIAIVSTKRINIGLISEHRDGRGISSDVSYYPIYPMMER